MDQVAIGKCARLALAAVGREHPYHVLHVVQSDADVRPPRDLWPSFHGAFDWHSAVHGHWCLMRALRSVADPALASEARARLDFALSPERMAAEADYLAHHEGFERPYGLAWLLQLAAEARERDDADARRWSAALAPAERVARDRLARWLERLTYPIRSGEHSQSAFAMGLALDWARGAGDEEFARLISERAIAFHGADRDAPVDWEPSGHDFLSPVLGEADLMRRVLGAPEFEAWVEGLFGGGPDEALRPWLTPARSPDRADGKLAHLDGLNLSRAWMLEGVATSLPAGKRAAFLAEAAAHHLEAGLEAVTGEHYAGSHWLGSFAVYALTGRGLRPRA